MPQRSRLAAAARLLALAATVLVIAVATLTPDGGLLAPRYGEPWCLVCGPHGGADVVRNVLLFLPFGLALRGIGLRVRTATLVALAATLLIEGAQLTVVGGRAATASDVVANTAGAFVGAAIAARWRRLRRPTAARARRLAALGGAAVVLVTAFGAWLVTPVAVPPDVRTMQLPLEQTLVRPYEGHVLAATLDGQVAVRDGAAVPGIALRSLREPVVVTASVAAMIPPGMLRPFVHAFTPSGRDVLVVGQRQRHLVLRVRQNGSRLRLHGPQVELRDAFPAAADIPPGDDPRRGPVVRVRVELRDGLVRLEAEGAGSRRSWRVPLSPHLAWVFVAGPVRIDWRTVVASAAWLAALLAPLAYWVRLGWGSPAAAAALVAGATLVLLAAPALAGVPPPAWWEWAGATGGLAAGWLLAGRATGRRTAELPAVPRETRRPAGRRGGAGRIADRQASGRG